jgi:ABC-type lipoprotein export system ATPase subunit
LIIATHSREIVRRADHVWRIRDGKLVTETAVYEPVHTRRG